MANISPFLALNSRGAATPQLKRFVNATPSFIGATFGVIDTDDVSLDFARGYPAVIKFGGSQTFLATVGLDIYRSTNGGTSWSSVKTFTGAHLNAARSIGKSGLFVLHVAGVATACIVTAGAAGTAEYYAHTSTNGTSWTTLGPFVAPFADVYDPSDSVVWDGKLATIWTRQPSTSTISSLFDPTTGTMTFATFGTSSGGNVQRTSALCVYQNRLFGLAHELGGASNTYFRELIAGVWTNVGTALFAPSLTDSAKHCLFVDGANMYAFTPNGTGWRAWKWNSALTRTEITSSVVPTALASGLGTSQRMSVIVDERGVPGTAPTIWLYQSVDGALASALNEWQWNGDTSFIGTTPGSAGSGPNDSGGSARDNLPYVKHAQGTTYWTSGEDFVELKGMAPAVGGVSVSFTLYSDAGSGTGSVRAWHGSNTAAYPLTAATLTGTLTGLTKDNTTVYTITWQAATDGYSSGQRAKFVLEKY